MNILTKSITIIISIGKKAPTREALRHVVIDPNSKIADIPMMVLRLVIISITPRIDGCLKTQISYLKKINLK